VIVQLSANLTDAKNNTNAYQSTYVLSRGSRTYLNAYAAIPHPNFHAFVDYSRGTGQILTIDTDGLVEYQLSSPVVRIIPINPDLKNKKVNFVIKAESKN
jgi:hypothetical protein